MTATEISPNTQVHIKRLKEIFNAPHPRADLAFSTPGYLDFHCPETRIEGGVEEITVNTNGLKDLILLFLRGSFFEPVFIVRNGELAALKKNKRNQQTRDEIILFPEYAWAPQSFLGVKKGFLDLEKQLSIVREECLEKIRFLDGLLEQLKSSEAIIKLAIDEILVNKKRKFNEMAYSVWKIVIYKFVE